MEELDDLKLIIINRIAELRPEQDYWCEHSNEDAIAARIQELESLLKRF